MDSTSSDEAEKLNMSPTARPVRRFAVQPIETSTKSHKPNSAALRRQLDPQEAIPRVEALPRAFRPKSQTSPRSDKTSEPSPSLGQSRRRFTPQLIETSRRIRKSSDSPSTRPSDKTDLSPGDTLYAPRHRQQDGESSASRLHASRFASSTLGRQQAHQHSYTVPHLATISSQPEGESSDSNCPSLSTSPSINSEEINLHGGSRARESCDDRCSAYLLGLASQAAEKQMALAAYPNEDSYQTVNHFAVDLDSDSDSDSGPRTAKNSWSSRATRQGSVRTRQQTLGRSKSHLKPASGFHLSLPESAMGLECMRDAARAPMLGQDLTFPTSLSPRQSRFDVTQYPYSQSETNPVRSQSGLWLSNDAPDHESTNGLWHGCCAARETTRSSLDEQLGIVTPRSNEGGTCQCQLPRETGINGQLPLEQEIDREIHDGFVTQVYNYLSLGYPSLARRYDDELSTITAMSVEDIRRHDTERNCGFVEAPEGEGPLQREVQDGRHGRWNALRLYMREWVRQQPRMRVDPGMAWGDVIRRGSWAI